MSTTQSAKESHSEQTYREIYCASQSPINKMKTVTALFLATIMLAVNLVQPQVIQGYREENFPLSAFTAQSCDTMIETHTFDGDCCALNNTDGNGCVLNVINGRCEARGQYWTLEYVSNYRAGGARCPPSEFMVGFTLSPTSAPSSARSVTSSLIGFASMSVIISAILALAM